MTMIETVEVVADDNGVPRRPLVIVYVGGGLVQDWTAKEGTGEPRVHVLDWDKEGAADYELEEFVEAIESARADLSEYFGTVDELKMLDESAEKFRGYIRDGESPPRYR